MLKYLPDCHTVSKSWNRNFFLETTKLAPESKVRTENDCKELERDWKKFGRITDIFKKLKFKYKENQQFTCISFHVTKLKKLYIALSNLVLLVLEKNCKYYYELNVIDTLTQTDDLLCRFIDKREKCLKNLEINYNVNFILTIFLFDGNDGSLIWKKVKMIFQRCVMLLCIYFHPFAFIAQSQFYRG